MPHLFKPWKHETSAAWVAERRRRDADARARRDARVARLAGAAVLFAGILLFAFDLRVLGAVLMLGGVLLILLDSGWVVLAVFVALALDLLRSAGRRMRGRA